MLLGTLKKFSMPTDVVARFGLPAKPGGKSGGCLHKQSVRPTMCHARMLSVASE